MEILSNKEITKESYQATAQEFCQNVMELAPIKSIETFLNFLPPKAKIIDIGCGSGRDAKLFTDKGADVLGIDFSSNLIEIARLQAPLANFQLMDIETMSLPASSFDGVWSACSLGHIAKNKLQDALRNIHSLLNDKGYFYLALKKGVGEKLEIDPRYQGDVRKFWAYYEEEELKDILQAASFKILDFSTVEKNHVYHTHDAMRVFCQK